MRWSFSFLFVCFVCCEGGYANCLFAVLCAVAMFARLCLFAVLCALVMVACIFLFAGLCKKVGHDEAAASDEDKIILDGLFAGRCEGIGNGGVALATKIVGRGECF